MQTTRFVILLALVSAGSKIAINNAITAITTKSSTNVKPSFFGFRILIYIFFLCGLICLPCISSGVVPVSYIGTKSEAASAK
jgi:hypothetical protein